MLQMPIMFIVLRTL
nr:unnamed protein product [Callosobruchus analis]CAI5849675.1 unnamed protein product [Callosobruchus analis]